MWLSSCHYNAGMGFWNSWKYRWLDCYLTGTKWKHWQIFSLLGIGFMMNKHKFSSISYPVSFNTITTRVCGKLRESLFQPQSWSTLFLTAPVSVFQLRWILFEMPASFISLQEPNLWESNQSTVNCILQLKINVLLRFDSQTISSQIACTDETLNSFNHPVYPTVQNQLFPVISCLLKGPGWSHTSKNS